MPINTNSQRCCICRANYLVVHENEHVWFVKYGHKIEYELLDRQMCYPCRYMYVKWSAKTDLLKGYHNEIRRQNSRTGVTKRWFFSRYSPRTRPEQQPVLNIPLSRFREIFRTLYKRIH